MITDDKHNQRLDKIPKAADNLHDDALDFINVLKRLSSPSRNVQNNMLKFEKQIRGFKNV